MNIARIEFLHADAAWRRFDFLKTTAGGGGPRAGD